MGVALGLLVALPRKTEAEPTQGFFPIAEQIVSSETLIRNFATFYGISPAEAFSIARCESKLDPRAKNPHSTAKGLFQFLDSSWRLYSLKKWGYVPDVYDPRFNAELGAWVIKNYGTSPWDSSKECWSA